MIPEHRNYVLVAVLAVIVIGTTAWTGSPVWYLNVLLLCLFGGIFYAVRTWHDRAFYYVCAGEPLIISCCAMNLWAGLLSIWVVAGIACTAMGMLNDTYGMRIFILFCGTTVPVALMIQVSNHVLLPILILAACTGAILMVQGIRNHQFRKRYGAHQ